ncbi:MAG: FGGY family carbohydrate kinase [Alphaproteobacteria bacterium]
MGYISIDSSTSSTTIIVFDEKLKIKKKFQKEHKQIFTPEGYVEHDLNEIYKNLIDLMRLASQIESNPKFISLTNQRETFALFDKETGRPVHNAIVWQCTRGQKYCDEIINNPSISNRITQKTGLKANSFFSASKLQWVLNNKPEIKKGIDNGSILFGTIDTYLIYRLSNCQNYITDTTNASRTLLFNCLENKWDEDLMSIFEITKSIPLPIVKSSSDHFGDSDFDKCFSKKIPIIGVVGDAQGSFFGNFCFSEGDTKITTGTGFNIQTNIGKKFTIDKNSFTSLAYTKGNENYYSLECLSSFAGATISWLKNNLRIIDNPNESEELSKKVNSSEGVYLIPAFTGLGPPFWKPKARASFFGINASTNKYHIIRASLESVAFQMVVYMESLKNSKNINFHNIVVDGGMVKNDLFLQIIADLLRTEIKVPIIEEMSSYGSLLMGIQKNQQIGDLEELKNFKIDQKVIKPQLNSRIKGSYDGWKDTIHKHFMR